MDSLSCSAKSAEEREELAALQAVLDLLEADFPATLVRADNAKLEDELAKVMQEYFEKLRQSLSLPELDRIYSEYVES
jgi:hypothetical protein